MFALCFALAAAPVVLRISLSARTLISLLRAPLVAFCSGCGLENDPEEDKRLASDRPEDAVGSVLGTITSASSPPKPVR
jgi:hypothetical protein